MPVSRQDYILRLIEQIGAALRRLRDLLARGGSAAEVVNGAQEAKAALFGSMWPVLSSVDLGTAVALIGDSRQLSLWGELLRIEADACRELGDDTRAAILDSQAMMLIEAARNRSDAMD